VLCRIESPQRPVERSAVNGGGAPGGGRHGYLCSNDYRVVETLTAWGVLRGISVQ